MTERPHYVLAATVLGGMRLKRFRDLGRGPGRVLEDPPGFRWAGFDLKTLDQARLIDDDCIEVRSGDRKVIQLRQNSLFVVRLAADNDFLGWGQDLYGDRKSVV